MPVFALPSSPLSFNYFPAPRSPSLTHFVCLSIAGSRSVVVVNLLILLTLIPCCAHFSFLQPEDGDGCSPFQCPCSYCQSYCNCSFFFFSFSSFQLACQRSTLVRQLNDLSQTEPSRDYKCVWLLSTSLWISQRFYTCSNESARLLYIYRI